MSKVINVEDIAVYKEAIKILKNFNINFNKKKLLENPELCREIIKLADYYEKRTFHLPHY